MLNYIADVAYMAKRQIDDGSGEQPSVPGGNGPLSFTAVWALVLSNFVLFLPAFMVVSLPMLMLLSEPPVR